MKRVNNPPSVIISNFVIRSNFEHEGAAVIRREEYAHE